MKNYLLVLVLVLSACSRQNDFILPTTEDRISNIVTQYRTFGTLDDVSVIWIDPDEVLSLHFGQSNDSSLYSLSDVSHLFTVLLYAGLLDQGRLSERDSLEAYWPTQVPDVGETNIELRHLASHTSALLESFDNTRLSLDETATLYANATVEDLFAFVSSQRLVFQPGTRYLKSQQGMAALAWVLSQRSGESYDALLQSRIASRLDLLETGQPSGLNANQLERILPALDPNGRSILQHQYGEWEGMQTVYSSPRDMRRMMETLLEPFSPLASELTRITTPQLGLGQNTFATYGLLLDDTNSEGRYYVIGSNHHTTSLQFSPAFGRAVIILSATANPIDVNAMARQIWAL
ncbi:MAG: serine hydrolase domain-containing protein [Bacteroidota bacterium]